MKKSHDKSMLKNPIEMYSGQVNMGKAEKRIVVLVDLLSYGIVELPIVYSLDFYGPDLGGCIVECRIELSNPSQHNWLCNNHFTIFFSKTTDCCGYVMSFEKMTTNNLYYHNMLNVISDYLAFKENFFR